MRPGVVEAEEEAVGIALADGGLQRAVIRKCVVIISGKLAPSRERTVRLNGFTCGHARRNAFRAEYLVDVRSELQIASVTADVGNRRHKVVCELMLNAELPFIDSPHWNVIRHIRLIGGRGNVKVLGHILRVRRARDVVESGSGRGSRFRESDQWSGTGSLVHVRGIARTGVEGPKTYSIAVIVLAKVIGIHPEPAANHRIVQHRPRKANTREENIVNRLLQRVSAVLGSNPQRA